MKSGEREKHSSHSNIQGWSSRLRLAFFFWCSLFIASFSLANEQISPSAESPDLKPTYYIYLAGPEVFLPDAIAVGEASKSRIAELSTENDWPFQLEGLYPFDNEIPDFAPNFETGLRIYHANIEMMDKADFIAANMVRFRGPSMDVGTAFEMGYMTGLGKPIFAYYEAEPFYGATETPGLFADRVEQFYGLGDKPGTDKNGQTIENFEMSDNLMMVGALQSANGTVAGDLDEAILQIVQYLLEKQGE